MAIWEYLEEGSVQKDLVVVKTASRTAGVYGQTYVDDQYIPEQPINLRTTEGVTAAELAALKALALTPNGTTSVTDNAGTTHSGRIAALTWKRAEGTNRYSVTLTLRPQTDE